MGADPGAPPGADRDTRLAVNGEPLDWREGMTVRDVLQAKNYVFKLLIVTVNGTLVPRGSYDDFVVPAGADVKVVHLISGG
ncbi:MAG: sulfur carrier protein ThiS [Thermoanaerobaculia bacterium]|jgi:sulfur carrier protein|nr:sulfur carrier protein ThiS [Thermoanaerobaculia bacterium]